MNKTIKRKRIKEFDILHWWLVDRVEQGQFEAHWKTVYLSLSDCVTKKHPTSHHRLLRPFYLYEEEKSPNSLQECIEILKRAKAPKAKHDSNRPL